MNKGLFVAPGRPSARHIIMLLFLMGFFFTRPAYANLFHDDLGRKVEIVPAPQRIVSLAPGLTETLFALGLEKKIVGVTIYCTYPAAARLIPKIGGFTNISIEKILSLNPDLIIGTADGNRKETILRLAELGLPVYVTNPTKVEGILRTVQNIGAITGREKEAAQLAGQMKNRVQALSALVAGRRRPRVFFQVGDEPVVTVGRDTLHNQLIALAGGENIAGDAGTMYPRFSVEEVVVREPEIIIMSPMKYDIDAARLWNKWKKWSNIPAVWQNRLYVIDTDLIDRASPRIVDALEELVRMIHPEAFPAGK